MTEERERVRQQLIADPRAVATIVAAVREQVPAYAALDDSRLHEVRAIAAWALDRLLHLWVTDGALTPADLRRFRGIAAARAADGRPMPAVLRAYRVAATVLTDEIAAATPPLGAPDAFALTRMALATLDTLAEEMATAYTATSEDLAGDRDRALRLLLDDLITGRHASIGALTDRAARLGVQLPAPYCLLVAEPTEVAGPAVTQEAALGLILGPLVQPGRHHLMEALTTYLDTGSANAAARRLGLHPQSLRYRLRRISDLTQRDPRDPWQRLTLDIARTIAH
ncbi:helix-turn-helix domain-containing protein [Streptomyces sp. WAC01526]|uniref:helix-turn-helix domain-containing protein n=1 Tax=Streptomyces sp. WAC01526 TaxID=2588709 RepID=UPI0011DF4684|nr:helix-turn-helix domain-containing protein [Streptomyces sp. WAC01526]